jgi:hypothetical protein
MLGQASPCANNVHACADSCGDSHQDDRFTRLHMAVRRGPRILYRRRHVLLRIAGVTPGDRRRAVLIRPRGGRSWIVDRKGGGKPPPKESGSFDLSKMSKAEIAAEIAARMARWRQTHQRPAVPPRAPPAIGRAAQSPITPSATPAAVQPVRMPELDMVMVTRIDRTLRIAARARASQAEPTRVRSGREPSYYGAAFRTLLQDGLNQNAIGMRPERSVDRPLPPARMAAFRAREVGKAPWRALAPAAPTGITRWRALRPALTHGIDVVQRRVRTTGLATLGAGMAAWQRLRPTLERRIGEDPAARPRARCRSARARQRGVAGTGGPVRDGGRDGDCRRDHRLVPDAAARHGSARDRRHIRRPDPKRDRRCTGNQRSGGAARVCAWPAPISPAFTRRGTARARGGQARRSGGILGAHAQTPTASANADGIPEAGAEKRRTCPA